MNALVAVWSQRGVPDEVPFTRARAYSPGPNAVRPGLDLRVLVVEDNAVNQKVARQMLVNLGCRVDVASTGREALELVKLAPYDVVFMDVQMPELDGLQATRELRKREGAGPRVPVVAMTAHAMPQDRDRCIEAGMDGYISKPVQLRDLLRALREHAALELSDGVSGQAEQVAEAAFSAPEPPCDLDWLRHTYGDDHEELRSLAEMFLARTAELTGQMKAAVAAGDATAVARQLHALKGISGTMAAWPLYHLVPDDPAEASARLEQLERACEELRGFYARELGLEPGTDHPR
jgi:CheY-like chemotaxis protein/HPt (histidine-containing phosphotransfer) domain-containing protein